MRTKFVGALALLLGLVYACSNSSTGVESKKQSLKFANTRSYLKANCLSCHSETAAESERLAPPFFAIRKHYRNRFPDEAEFVSAMSDFLRNPRKEHALMRGAVDKFGLMPSLSYPEGKLEEIAEYLYHVEQVKPNHKEKDESPLAQGKKLAMATKKVLGKNLMGAIQDSGTAYALRFCNTRAIPLTDSMSNHLKHAIKRVSDRPRNQNNRANFLEMEILDSFRDALEQGANPKGVLREMEGKTLAYYPILTNAMCLQCHGNVGSTLESSFYENVKLLYPDDEAIGYESNQLRGMWVVELTSSK